MPMFKIKCINGAPSVSVEAELTCKVLDFKELISPKGDVPAAKQRLVYSGKVLKDTETLESYKLKEGRTVHMANTDEPDESTPNPGGALQCCLFGGCLRIPFM
jgi:ubiquilin